jgi:AmmeMemoRadiSam system protein A
VTPDRELGAVLVSLARDAIGAQYGLPSGEPRRHTELDRPGATFVTLKLDGELRGCIGSLEARRALSADVRANAVAAAFHDPRFRPLTALEFEATLVEVSLLSSAEPVTVADEADLLLQLRPGVDGLVLEYGHRRSTFLPQVWESLPEPRNFLGALKKKAGLDADFWSAELRIKRYSVAKWKQGEFDAATIPP